MKRNLEPDRFELVVNLKSRNAPRLEHAAKPARARRSARTGRLSAPGELSVGSEPGYACGRLQSIVGNLGVQQFAAGPFVDWILALHDIGRDIGHDIAPFLFARWLRQ